MNLSDIKSKFAYRRIVKATIGKSLLVDVVKYHFNDPEGEVDYVGSRVNELKTLYSVLNNNWDACDYRGRNLQNDIERFIDMFYKLRHEMHITGKMIDKYLLVTAQMNATFDMWYRYANMLPRLHPECQIALKYCAFAKPQPEEIKCLPFDINELKGE